MRKKNEVAPKSNFPKGKKDYVPPRNKFLECLTRNYKG
jgi:hypothetical protein